MRRRVAKVPLPPASRLNARLQPGDFTDTYACTTNLTARQAATLATRFPWWVYLLLALRQLFVLPFGLKGAARGGDRAGIFPVAEDHGDELILGFDDRHLDFRISVLKQGDKLMTSTWVRRHNRFGRVYLAMVLPFHRLIMRHAVARVARGG